MFIDNAKLLICSEAVGLVLKDCNAKVDMSVEYNKPFDLITPENVAMSKYIKIVR